MIRLFKALCKTINCCLTDEDIFQKATDDFNHYNEKCPSCGASGQLSPYDCYSRNLVSYYDGKTVLFRVSPVRFKCASCGTTHALIPDVLIPYSPYSLSFKLAALLAYFERETTVVGICNHFDIAVSTLYSWKKLLLKHKELLLGVLASTKVPTLDFLRKMFGTTCLSDQLRNFYQRYAFSFLQHRSTIVTHSEPP